MIREVNVDAVANTPGPRGQTVEARGPTRKEEQAQRSRQSLLEAATALFAERGYRDTSVQAIAERAGISRGSIFWHFGSKEKLLLAVTERAFAEWESEVLIAEVGDATGIEAMRRALHAHRTFLLERTEPLRLFYVMIFEALGPRPELAQHFADLHVHLRALGVEWLGAGVESGDVRDDVDVEAAVTMIIAVLGGIAYQWLLDPGGFDVECVYRDLERTFERGLGPER